MKTEKRERILNAAIKEFAQKGFKKASTDEIVKEAGISKGALFHYFNNKKDLFLFLYDYSLDILMNQILLKFNYDEKDFFERLRQGSMLKFEIWKKHPEMFDFIVIAYMEDSIDVKNEIGKRSLEVITKSQGFLYEGIDYSKFKDGVDTRRAIEIIIWTMEGFTNREVKNSKILNLNEQNYSELIKESDIYLEMLKKSFYK